MSTRIRSTGQRCRAAISRTRSYSGRVLRTRSDASSSSSRTNTRCICTTTPSKSLFGRSERAFSHGCIRTQNPFDLAERLLAPAGWDRARIDAQIESEETRTVHLAAPLPVLLLYWTADIGRNGEYYFYKDIYERDQRVLDALDAPFEPLQNRNIPIR